MFKRSLFAFSTHTQSSRLSRHQLKEWFKVGFITLERRRGGAGGGGVTGERAFTKRGDFF